MYEEIKGGNLKRKIKYDGSITYNSKLYIIVTNADTMLNLEIGQKLILK